MGILQRNKYIRFINKVIKSIISFPLLILGVAIPKSKTIWIYGNTAGYKDNPKYLYEHQLSDRSIRSIWISKKKNINGIAGEWYYYLSFKGIWLQFRAGVACIGTGGSDVASFAIVKTFIVQLWHGVPIKKLLLDSPEISPFPNRFAGINRLYYWFLRLHLKKYNMLIAVNEHNRKCLSQAFGLNENRVVITGLPRHDIILSSAKRKQSQAIKVLYAPTWRPSVPEAERCIRTVLTHKSISYFTQKNIQIDVSIHPLNSEMEAIVQSMNGINLYKGDDINVDLPSYTILVTDYSSIAIDFSILKRPVIFVCDDVAKYAKERGIYEYFMDIIKSCHITTDVALITLIEQIITTNRYLPDFGYHLCADGNACKRIIDEIKRKIF